jgi:hypothetical protein
MLKSSPLNVECRKQKGLQNGVDFSFQLSESQLFLRADH